jgi:hypothetical protein
MSGMENEGMARRAGQNAGLSEAAAGEAEATLRLLASLPVPEGLSERVQAGLRRTMQQVGQQAGQQAARTGKVVAWPARSVAGSVAESGSWLPNLLRVAAAAAIVCVAAGGAWGIYARVGTGAAASAVSAPVPVRPAGGFSSAGAVRTPETLNGPVLRNPALKHEPVVEHEADKQPGDKKAGKKKDSAGAVPALTPHQ